MTTSQVNGYSHAFVGTVIHGDQRGRTLGYPTANLRIPRDRLPKDGVYAGRVDGMPAAVSVGVRPTFGSDLEPILEAHVIDFDGDLYGKVVTVLLIDRLRDELTFDSPASLIAQIQLDIEAVRALLN